MNPSRFGYAEAARRFAYRRYCKEPSLKRVLLGAALVCCALGTLAFAASTSVTLPNGWVISAPPSTTAAVGTLPSAPVLSRDGSRLFVLDGGHRKPVLHILDAKTLAPVGTVKFKNAYGVPLRDANGDGVWIANTSTFQEQISHVDTGRGVVDRTVSMPIPFFASAMAMTRDGKTMAVAGDLANRVVLVDVASGAITKSVMVGRHPAALAFTNDGRTLYVANRAENSVDAIDVATATIRKRITVGLHPAALAVWNQVLLVANSDDDDVSVVMIPHEHLVATMPLPFATRGVVGDSPNSLTLAGNRLYVSCGAANAVAVFQLSQFATREPATTTYARNAFTKNGFRIAALGAIPTGWYPTGVAVSPQGDALFIADGKGESGHANPLYRPIGGTGQVADPTTGAPGYIADNIVGDIRRITVPNDATVAGGTADVRSLGAPYANATPPANAIVRPGGPIKHVIYIIKENRTYDQVLGDLPNADGDAALTLFGRSITPNEHAISERFGIFDRFFDNAHVSADGHNWSMAAFANDYLEHMWPINYDSRRPYYDFEDGAEASTPHNRYLWNLAIRGHVSFRNYGEFVSEGPNDGLPVSTTYPELQARTDLRYPTFDNDIRDVDRFTEWKREFDAFEQSHTLPAFEIVRFPRDHTAGTRPGNNTPQAMVGDNDQAVGMLVDAVSHSADWGSTAIFVLEDDAQNGPDHVDEQRSTFYLASPYAKGGTQHAQYTTASVIRTMELFLGLPPLTPYDAGSLPMFDAFTTTPNLTPYALLPATTDLNAKNTRTAYRAGDSARLDFAHADAVPDAELNDILWHAVKGARTPVPPFGAFDSRESGRNQDRDS